MNWDRHCAAVIPCLNEREAVGRIVAGVRKHLPTVLVVDDGSSDDTAMAATHAGAQLLRHSVPLGKAAALKAGFRWAGDRAFQWVITLDGDGQHAPSDIPAFFREADRTAARLVVGNRMWNSPAIPWVRRLANRWSSRQLSRLAGQSLPDSQCGFRLVHLDLCRRLDLRSPRYLFESEFLLEAARAGAGVRFVPIEVIYRGEQSKVRPLRDTLRWLRWWWPRYQAAQWNAARAGSPDAPELCARYYPASGSEPGCMARKC